MQMASVATTAAAVAYRRRKPRKMMRS